MLDYKYWYVDGEYLRWTSRDVESFLLDWVPRKVLMPSEHLGYLSAGVRDFLRFLGDRRLLTDDSAPVPELVATVAWAGPELATQMADPSNFGMAKGLMAGLEGIGDLAPLPARPAADVDEATTVAEASLGFRRLKILHEYFTTPRSLTQNGNLKLADAANLVEALETDDRMDEWIGDRQFKTQSSRELTKLVSIIEFAKRVKVIRLYGGKLTAVKSWGGATRPLATSLGLIDTTIELGSMAFDFATPDDEVKSVIESMTPSVLFWIYESDRSYKEVESAAFRVIDEIGPRRSTQWLATLVPLWVERNLSSFEQLGVIEWNDFDTIEEYGRTYRRNGVLSLTELGVLWAQESAEDYGFSTPLGDRIEFDLGLPRDAIAATLADALDRGGPGEMIELLMRADGPDRVADVVSKLWMADHPAVEAVLAAIESVIPNAKVRRAAHRSLWQVRNR